MQRPPLAEIAKELQRFPEPVLQEFRQALEHLDGVLHQEELPSWAAEGLALAQQTVRSWEAAVEYYRASPRVARLHSFSTLHQWARSGALLCQDAPAVATAFFKASPAVMGRIRPQHIPRWASLGQSLYKGTWKSSNLATRFFDLSPGLTRELPFWEVELLVSLIEALAQYSYDTASECLLLGQDTLSRMGKEREALLSLAQTLVEVNWREVKSLLEVSPRALQLIDQDLRGRFVRLMEQLVRHGHREVAGQVLRGSQALSRVSLASHQQVLDLCELLLPLAPAAVPCFLESLPTVLSRISLSQLPLWFQEGVHLLQERPDGGLAYFKLESSRSQQVLDTLSSCLELDRVKELMRRYCHALAGTPVEICPTRELVSRGIGWVSEDHASTEGTRVFLPVVVDHYTHKGQNFAWLKVVATHLVAHLEFGSFEFQFERSSTRFSDLRLALEQEHGDSSSDGLGDPADDGSAERGWLTDMGRFFSLFDDRRLALDIFTVVEDGRLDCRVKYEYPGIAASYVQVQQEALRERPPLEKMPLRQAMVEFLVRLSLQQDRGLPAPVGYLRQARALAAILQRLLTPGATVEDTAEATIRIYRVLSQLPNEELPPEQWQPQDFDQEELSDQELEELLDELRGGPGQDQPSTEGEQYQSPPEVEYRGEFKPEIVQLLSKLRQKQSRRGGEAQGQPLSREMLEQLLKESAELELDTASGELSSSVGLFVNNLMREAGITPPPSSVPGQGYGLFNHEDEQGGPLEAHEPHTYVYDEWDFRAGDYKPRWCIVREKTVEEGDTQFFQETLHSYSSLMEEIRRQFELVVPESFRKIRPLKDGEDLDLDAALEATLDLRTGRTPSEKVYWRRNKVERDVAVVFLLDMSASTAEAIDEGRHYVDDQDAPNDPVEYMLWLRSRREGALRRQYKRIIDIEKESTALLIQALETIGDTYGIYGFSGYGRENVEFYVIKDVEESFTDRVKRRLDKVTPLHATRMGPAIRHATEKLERQDTKTKILFLISDGRPQDRGYSREGVEKEYAIHDTKMALVEARRKSIHPFCLTVDKAGHDYLKAMCGDLGYEVLADIWALPQRLPMLYRRLTV